jgi:hypothetical protein
VNGVGPFGFRNEHAVAEHLRRFAVLSAVVVFVFAVSCGGSPTGPGGTRDDDAGTATIDGQPLQFTSARNASKAGRRPPNAAWPRGLMDFGLARCSGGAGVIAISIYEGNPGPGRYEVTTVPLEGVFQASWQPRPAGDSWYAGAVHKGSSGSITLSSISSTRVSGSFDFTLVPQFGGTNPPTKRIEGTFDLDIIDRVVCP